MVTRGTESCYSGHPPARPCTEQCQKRERTVPRWVGLCWLHLNQECKTWGNVHPIFSLPFCTRLHRFILFFTWRLQSSFAAGIQLEQLWGRQWGQSERGSSLPLCGGAWSCHLPFMLSGIFSPGCFFRRIYVRLISLSLSYNDSANVQVRNFPSFIMLSTND